MKDAILSFLIQKVVSSILGKWGVNLPRAVHDWLNGLKQKHREKVQEKAQKTYDTVVAKPEATAEEKAKAYEDLINAGRF